MKKGILFIASALAVCAACEHNPDYNDLSTQNLVYVDYNESYNLKNQKIWLDSTILIIPTKSTAVPDTLAKKNALLYATVVSRFRAELSDLGLLAESKDSATVAVVMAYKTSNYQIVDWYTPWNNWYGGWGYWGAYNGWGGPGGYLYTYQYSLASLLVNMIDFTATSPKIVWCASISSEVGSGGYPTVSSMSAGIDYAFSMPPFDN
jgi:hypothetical protein